MPMYGVVCEYGQQRKPWQKNYKTPLYHYYYEKGLQGENCLLLVSMRFLRIASGLRGRYTLHKHKKRRYYDYVRNNARIRATGETLAKNL